MSAPTNLHRDLGRIEGKLDAVLGEIRGDIGRLRQGHDELDQRVTRIEKAEAERHGAMKLARLLWGALAGLIGAVAGAAASALGLGR